MPSRKPQPDLQEVVEVAAVWQAVLPPAPAIDLKRVPPAGSFIFSMVGAYWPHGCTTFAALILARLHFMPMPDGHVIILMSGHNIFVL